MANFLLTATRNIDRANGFHIDRGCEIAINIPMMGIGPNNLFQNSRCKDTLIRQFQLQGINIPPTDLAFYSRGTWDIRML